MRAIAVGLVLTAACGRLDFTAGGRSADAGDAPSDATDVLAGCVLRLEMNEASWASGLVDSCGGHAATASGGASPTTDPERGRVGELVGDPSCVTIPDAPDLRGGAAITISAWVEPTQFTPNSFGIVSKRVDFMNDTAYSVFVWASNAGTGAVNHLYVDVDSENERFELPSPDLLNAWHQVTVVYDGAQIAAHRISIYIDGAFESFAPESSASIPTPSMPPDLAIGCLPLGGPAQSLVGRLDDVVIWSRALPASDVATWYAATR